MPTDHGALADSLRSALHDLVPPPAPGLTDLAGRVGTVLETARAVLEVDAVGLLLLDADARARVVACCGPSAAALEQQQADLNVGPGIDVLGGADAVAVADLASDDRWGSLGAVGQAEGIHGVLSTPVTVGDAVVGNLDVIRTVPWDWQARDLGAAGIYAEAIALLLALTVQGAAS